MSSRVFVQLLVNCHHEHIHIFFFALCLDLMPHILKGRMPVSWSDYCVWGELSPRRKIPVYREVRFPDLYSRSGKGGRVCRIVPRCLGLGANFIFKTQSIL